MHGAWHDCDPTRAGYGHMKRSHAPARSREIVGVVRIFLRAHLEIDPHRLDPLQEVVMKKLFRSRRDGLLVALGLGATSATGCFRTSETSIALGSESALIGPEGGTIRVGSTEVVIPPGALTEPTDIQLEVSPSDVPGIFQLYSPVVHFEPEGLVLRVPAEVRIPFDGEARLASAFTGVTARDAFAAVPTSIEGGRAILSLSQLNSTFVGTACEGGCCDAANGELDVLLVVDNSGSMREEQELLLREFPRLARVLASGDRNGDGIQDFPALHSVHLGVTSTDLGSGAESNVRTCQPGFGHDGIVIASPGSESGIAAYEATDPTSLERFVGQVSATTMLGTDGCGFEQPLEASLLALSTPEAMPESARGYEGRTGHARDANLGLVREGSMLAVIYVTDENDMSVADSAVFGSSDPRFSLVPANVRGLAFESDPTVILPISRYVENLGALRADPSDFIFAAVTGIPLDAVPDAAHPDFAALGSNPEMQDRADETGNSLVPACSSANGTAAPSRRIASAAEDLEAMGARTVLASICEADFQRLLDGILAHVGGRASGSCE